MTDGIRRKAERLDESVRVAKEIGARGGARPDGAEESAMVLATAAPADGAYRVFKRLLDAYGLRYALYSILRLTDYRFVTVFRLEDGRIVSLAHVDREDLSVLETTASAESASYCCYVRSEDGPFVVVDAAVDPRVDGHEKRDVLRAYCGVPITSAGGDLLGTLCHYDTIPRDPAQLNTELLVRVSTEIVRSGAMG